MALAEVLPFAVTFFSYYLVLFAAGSAMNLFKFLRLDLLFDTTLASDLFLFV